MQALAAGGKEGTAFSWWRSLGADLPYAGPTAASTSFAVPAWQMPNFRTASSVG